MNDADGTSYYYRGSVRNNYVQFAGFYWRIIRINGDGSIRLLYAGTTKDATGTNAQIGTSAFNTNRNLPLYVGYMLSLIHISFKARSNTKYPVVIRKKGTPIRQKTCVKK